MMLALVLLLIPQTPAERAREVVDLLLAEKYAAVEERFNAEMKKALPPGKLAEGAGRLKTFGAMKEILKPEVNKVSGMDLVVVPVMFEKFGVNIQMTFDQKGEIAGLFFRPRLESNVPWQPPAYSKPEAFRAEDVVVGAGGEWPLPGTLLVPAGRGRFPALVLVHGSGPNDRDESVGGAKVFRDLAEGLASRGIAVLRYEKRTRRHAAKFAGARNFTIDDEAVDDAVAAAALLRARPDVDRIYVLGHSLGGYVAPRIGKRDPKLAGLVIIAGNTRPIEDLVVDQTAYLAPGKAEEMKQVAAKIKALKPGEASPPVLNAPASYWLDLRGYRPAEVARTLQMPMLVLQGERDYQVTMTDFAGWRAALKNTAAFRSYPKLNHLFIEGEGKSTPAEYMRPGHVSAEVIDDIAAWILKR